MSASWWAHAVALSPETREIDNHYHVARIASDVGQIIEYQRAWLENQRAAVREDLSATTLTDHEFREIAAAIGMGSVAVSHQLHDVEDLLKEGFGALEESLCELAGHMADLAQEMRAVKDILRHPRRTRAEEMVAEAERALASGMNSDGDTRKADYTDALQLIESVLADPIGRRNPTAWFHRGWLNWKHLDQLEAAEESFFHAARLARNGGNEPQIVALRHLAQARYVRKNFIGAVDAIREALALDPSRPEVLYDGARFACRSGDRVQALAWLGASLDRWPSLATVMLHESDLIS